MNSKKALCLTALVAALLTSCSGQKNTCTTNCGGGNATVSITLYDTPPSGMTLLSFTLPIAGISLKPSSGSAIPLAPVVSQVEATRLQTDSVLLVDAASVAAGTYTLSVSFGATSATSNAFINESSSTITWSGGSCTVGAVCYLPAGALATINLTNSFTLASGQSQWIGLDLNLANAITTTGGLSVDFSQTGVLTATTTTRAGLPSGAADTVEDFTGKVTAYTSGSSLTVQNAITSQSLTVTLNGSTEYDVPLPSGNAYANCGSSTAQNCLKVGSTVSVDASLSASGTLTATEVAVLDATAVDEIEGVIYPSSNGTACPTNSCFGLILADKSSVSSNAVLAATTTTWGTGVFLNVASVSSYAVDAKNLTNSIFDPTAFFPGTGLLAGQEIRAQVSSVTSSSGKITAVASAVLLRPSRLTGLPSNFGQLGFSFAPPPYINAFDPQLGTTPVAEAFNTTLFDGISAGVGNIPSNTNVSIRALLLNSTNPTFAVAKLRVP